jgi:hypothetical protein
MAMRTMLVSLDVDRGRDHRFLGPPGTPPSSRREHSGRAGCLVGVQATRSPRSLLMSRTWQRSGRRTPKKCP